MELLIKSDLQACNIFKRRDNYSKRIIAYHIVK